MSDAWYRELGQTGLRRFGSQIDDEFLPALKEDKAHRVYREMRDNDPVVGAIIFAIDMLIRQVEWRVEPSGETSDAQDLARFVTECMEDMSHTWSDFISDVLSMLVYGWSLHEIVYKVRVGPEEDSGARRSRFTDKRIGWRKLAHRAQDTCTGWVFAPDGAALAMRQSAPPDYKEVTIPLEKCLLFRTSSTHNNPTGRSLLRNAYRPWYFKKRIEEIEGIGIERDLAGLPIALVDPAILSPDASPEDKAMLEAIKRLVSNIRRDSQEGIVFPLAYNAQGNLAYDLRLLSSGGTRQFSTDAVIARYSREIAMTVLADFILLGHEKVGSFALSSDKTDLFGVAISAWLKGIADVLNRYAVPRLMRANGVRTDKLPVFVPGDIETPELGSLGSYLQTLAGLGMPLFPNEALESYLLQVASLPQRRKEDDDFAAKLRDAQREQLLAQAQQPPESPQEA